jgi:hypothetical protein
VSAAAESEVRPQVVKLLVLAQTPPPLHGQSVTTNDLNQDSLPYYVDFRAPFSTCIRDWLGFDPQPIFQIGGETYDENVGSSLFA